MAILYDKKSLLENKKFLAAAEEIYACDVEKSAERVESLVAEHIKSVNGETLIFSSPGRIEVCGNHTDHNNGKVLAAAVSVDLLAAVTPLKERKIVVKSMGYPVVEVDIDDLEPKKEEEGTSYALVRGVCRALKDRGYALGGFYATTVSDVFKGAGMSSSASFEVFVAEVENALYNGGVISAVEKAIVSQYAENVFFGKPSGLMDQSAIALGGVSYIDFIDPAAPEVEKLNWEFDDTTVFVVNCGGDHCELTPQYAAIRTEMEEVAALFGQEKLRFVDAGEFYTSIPAIKDKVSGRYALIVASGESSYKKLQNCYAEGDHSEPIPLALALCESYDGVRAFRVHGGGFAGTVLAFVDNDAKEEFNEYMGNIFGKENVYMLKIRNSGAVMLDLDE